MINIGNANHCLDKAYGSVTLAESLNRKKQINNEIGQFQMKKKSTKLPPNLKITI